MTPPESLAMSPAQILATASTPPSTSKGRSFFAASPAKQRRATVCSEEHSAIQDWLSNTEVEPLDTAQLEKGTDFALDRRPSSRNDNALETNGDDTPHESRSPKRRRLNPECGSAGRLTREALRKLEGKDMESTVTPSEQTSTKGSNVTPYNSDFILALRDRSILFASSDLRPDNFYELEKALATDGKSPDLAESTVTLLRQVRELGAAEIDVVAELLNEILPVLRGPCSSNDDYFVYDQPWVEGVLVQQERRPALSVPKADRAFGWSSFAFPFPKATQHLGCTIRPVPSRSQLCWPYLTIELKGETGSLRIASLQNLHNGAVMLNNLLSLKRAVGKEEEFFNQTHILSVEFTTETVTLSCYWASRHDDEGIKYHGRRVKSWLVDDPQTKASVFGAIVWMKERNFEWISRDMKELERRLENPNHGMLPPPSRSGRGSGQKRKNCQSLSRTGSRDSLR